MLQFLTLLQGLIGDNKCRFEEQEAQLGALFIYCLGQGKQELAEAPILQDQLQYLVGRVVVPVETTQRSARPHAYKVFFNRT